MNQPHTIIIQTATHGTDARGDEVRAYTETTARGWVQQNNQSETLSDRDIRVSAWVLFSTETPDMTALDRVVWDGKTFVCDGQPNHLTTPRGYHHTEANLELVEG